jgi:hypothetical protein
MKTPLVAAFALLPLVAVAAESPLVGPKLNFEMPPLKAADALKLRPLIQSPPAIDDSGTRLRMFSFHPAMPLPKAQIMVPKNVDPNLPIQQPRASIDPGMIVQVPGTPAGK